MSSPFPLVELAKLSSLVYMKFEKSQAIHDRLRKYIEDLGYHDLQTYCNVGTDTQLMSVVKDNVQVLAFRGTEGIRSCRDFRTNFDIKLYPLGDGRLYLSGITKASQSIPVSWYRDTYRGEHDAVVYTGHSLGGVLASYAFYAHERHRYANPASCYTFGAFKDGGNDAPPSLVARHFNVSTPRDLVPSYPLGFGYAHQSTSISIDHEGDFISPPGFWGATFARLGGLLQGSRPVTAMVKSHGIKNYIKLLGDKRYE